MKIAPIFPLTVIIFSKGVNITPQDARKPSVILAMNKSKGNIKSNIVEWLRYRETLHVCEYVINVTLFCYICAYFLTEFLISGGFLAQKRAAIWFFMPFFSGSK